MSDMENAEENVQKFADALVRVATEEQMPCTFLTFVALAQDLWEHSKENLDIATVVLPDESFMESFGEVALDRFWRCFVDTYNEKHGTSHGYGRDDEEAPAVGQAEDPLLLMVGRLWYLDALKEAGEVPQHVPDGAQLQWLIDNVADHNQLMIDAIESVSPDLGRLMRELMESESEADYEVWTRLATRCFDKAKEVAEAAG